MEPEMHYDERDYEFGGYYYNGPAYDEVDDEDDCDDEVVCEAGDEDGCDDEVICEAGDEEEVGEFLPSPRCYVIARKNALATYPMPVRKQVAPVPVPVLEAEVASAEREAALPAPPRRTGFLTRARYMSMKRRT